MKTSPALTFALALVLCAAAPGPTEIAPALVLPDLAPAPANLTPADPPEIGTPAPVPQTPTCFEECTAIRAECDANCTTTLCHRECRDSAIQCLSDC
jgi:hypothetical protein